MTISLSLRFWVLQRDSYTCQYCGRRAPETELEVDHVLPRADGGLDDPENLTTSCRDCNRGKGVRHAIPPQKRRVSLVGKFFHTFDEHRRFVEEQGVIVAEIDNGYFLIQMFDWMGGGGDWASRRVVHLSAMSLDKWAIYESEAEMSDAYRYGGIRAPDIGVERLG